MNRKQILIVILALMAMAAAAFAGKPNQQGWKGYSVHITTAGTTTVTSSTAFVSTIVISCSNGGTGFTIRIQDKGSTPKVLVQPITLSVPATGTNLSQTVEEPLVMTGGIDIITGGTPGVVDVWISYWQ
jgi:hypothetical protein